MSMPAGLPDPRPDQQYQRSGAAMAPGSQTPVVRARQVIVSGSSTGGGVFVYSGTPAPGNPPVDYMSNSATDPFGNVLPQAGTVAYVSAAVWAALTGGQLLFGDGTTVASVGGTARFENGAASAVVLAAAGNINIDPAAGNLTTNGNNITGLFGNLDPSGMPIPTGSTLPAVITAVNSMFSRFQVMGVFL